MIQFVFEFKKSTMTNKNQMSLNGGKRHRCEDQIIFYERTQLQRRLDTFVKNIQLTIK
jgi:hypothetical protein